MDAFGISFVVGTPDRFGPFWKFQEFSLREPFASVLGICLLGPFYSVRSWIFIWLDLFTRSFLGSFLVWTSLFGLVSLFTLRLLGYSVGALLWLRLRSVSVFTLSNIQY